MERAEALERETALRSWNGASLPSLSRARVSHSDLIKPSVQTRAASKHVAMSDFGVASFTPSYRNHDVARGSRRRRLILVFGVESLNRKRLS